MKGSFVVKKLSVILTDLLGILMLIGAVVFGWIPGPGGVPLLLGGLGLLSINHVWARKLLIKAKDKGSSLYEVIFPNNTKIHWLYDMLGLIVGSTAIFIITQDTKNLTQSLAIAAVFVSVGLLVTNRRRLEKISAFAKKLNKSRTKR